MQVRRDSNTTNQEFLTPYRIGTLVYILVPFDLIKEIDVNIAEQ